MIGLLHYSHTAGFVVVVVVNNRLFVSKCVPKLIVFLSHNKNKIDFSPQSETVTARLQQWLRITMTHRGENGPSFTFNEPYVRDLDGPLPHGGGNKLNLPWPWIWCALTSCCSLKTPRERNLCHCHSSCPRIHCRGTHCHVTRYRGILSRSHSSRCHPSLHLRVRAGVAGSFLRMGSPTRLDAHGCCRSPQRPIPTRPPARPHPALHNPHCNCWPCGEVD